MPSIMRTDYSFPKSIWTGIMSKMRLIQLVFCAAVLQAGAAPLPLPFQDSFTGPLDPAWKLDVSEGNSLKVVDGALQIAARINTYAHIERPLGVDLVRASCTLQPKGGVSWVSSLFLYWDDHNWCQVSVLEQEPSYYAVELIEGKLHEYRQSIPAASDWHHVAICLGRDCVRFQSSPDGHGWTNWLVLERPASWVGKAPASLILGKGFSRDENGQHYANSDLNNDYADPGPITISLAREVKVEPAPESELLLTDLERKRLIGAGRDWLGEEELARETDPSFESVSQYLPPMRHPREAVGVKDGPQEFVVMPDGSLKLGEARAWFEIGTPPFRFGQGNCSKQLYEGYLPIVIASQEGDGLKLEQTALSWSRRLSPDAPLSAIVRLSISNTGNAGRKVAVKLVAEKPAANWDIEVGPGEEQSVYARIPFSEPAKAVKIDAATFARRLQRTADWWEELLSKGIRIHVPEQRVNDAYRAWLAWNFIDVDKKGDVYEPHDGGGGFYEEVFGYSASRYCHALDLIGYPHEAERYLDSILTFVKPDGLLVVNYGLPDTGAQLWAMGQHFQITRDAAWLKRVAPTMIKMCDWIIRTRKESTAKQGPEDAWYGLIKYKPYCDEPTAAYSYHTDTYLAMGMQEAAKALKAIGMSDPAERIGREAVAYKANILTSMKRAVLERNGIKMLPVFPETHALLERVGYSGADYYSLVSSMVLETDIIPAGSPMARYITDLLEQHRGLCLGACRFGDGIDHAYSYGYWMNCLQRDEIKRVILGFYTSLAYGMSRGTWAGVEVTHLRTGNNEGTLPHLYSGTQQMLLLRNMLLREDGDALWIGQAIPRPWLENGKEVRVENAPTLFGKTAYSIQSENNAREMTVNLDPPAESPPRRIYLRLRQPDHRRIRSVLVNGSPWRDFQGETVTLVGLKGHSVIQVKYE